MVSGKGSQKRGVQVAKLRTKGENLYIDDGLGGYHRVLRGWESQSGWYWFATKKVGTQLCVLNRKEIEDTIWFGFIQGYKDEWGTFSQAEIESLRPKTWEILKENLHFSGRR